MSNKNNMSKQEKLDAIKASYMKAIGEEEEGPGRHPAVQGFGPNIIPEKPDPERDANRLIEAAVNGRSPAVNSMVEARSANPINPETGMPFYNPPEVQTEEDPQDAERREIRMKLLREAAKTGRMPAYLQKK